MDQGYDAEQFATYMEHYKPGGNDINAWTYQELVIMVDDFKKCIASGQNPSLMYANAPLAYDQYSYGNQGYGDSLPQSYDYSYPPAADTYQGYDAS